MNKRYFKLSINVDSSPALFLQLKLARSCYTDILYGYTEKNVIAQVLIL